MAKVETHQRTSANVVLCGDVMLGRLVDKLFKVHTEDESLESKQEERYMAKYRTELFGDKPVPHSYVWGNLLPYFHSADLRIINLETSVTTSNKKWPKKAFNYRMHPANLQCLVEAKIDYCSLANNHILDYQEQGMFDTFTHLKEIGVPFAGAGVNSEEAIKPAILNFCGVKMAVFSFSDHYHYWAATSTSAGINFIDPENIPRTFYDQFSQRIQTLKKEEKVDLIMISIHWGSNYAWQPPHSFTTSAHAFIDSCNVDIIHGHSSHHVQGIEIYKKKIILYGCGDFIDDYAVDQEYRNDLGFLYSVYLDLNSKCWTKLELIPTRIKSFQVNKAEGRDLQWLQRVIVKLSEAFGSKLVVQPDGHLILQIN